MTSVLWIELTDLTNLLMRTSVFWLSIGSALAGMGFLTAALALTGFGSQSSCGTWGLNCTFKALVWLFGFEGAAVVPLWLGVAETSRGSTMRYVALGLAYTTTLMLGVSVFAGFWVFVAAA
ncbi:hypothetical protein [Viridibacterium curvum]|uniref:Uncharacterized protein n=1 Tax=Viridibacterium curvum TaxID=1101404 RepID=A0ABP9QEC4_9RHOO